MKPFSHLKNIPGIISNPNDIFVPEGFQISTLSLVLTAVAINFFSLALPIMTLQVYDRILPNPGTGTFPILIIGACVAVFLEAVLRLCRSYVVGRTGAAYEHRLGCMAMEKVLGADISKQGSEGVGEHLNRMSSVGKLKDFYNGQALSVYTELIFVPIFIGLIAYIGGELSVVPITILCLFVLISFIKGGRLRTELLKREQTDEKRFNFLIESLEGIHTLKAFALESFFQRRYEALEEKSTYANYRVMQETADTFNLCSIFSHIMVVSVTSFGAWMVLEGDLTTGSLIASLLLSGRIMQPVQKGLSLWTRYQDFEIAKKHLRSLLATPQRDVKKRRNHLVDVHSDGRLEVRNLSFTPPRSHIELLKDINLKMKRGDTVLLSGAHGSGKTMLFQLISGHYQVNEGQIFIDGEHIDTYQPEDLVNHIGYIRSDPKMFRGTIRDNITCFGQVSETQAKEVAKLLNVDKDVAKLPSGFDTFLQGNSADTISPGLIQRIGIVRALATKPRLILFDNADRSLDAGGYAMVYKLLARLQGSVSMILVSEDQNIRGLANRHYMITNRTLVEDNGMSKDDKIKPYSELKL